MLAGTQKVDYLVGSAGVKRANGQHSIGVVTSAEDACAPDTIVGAADQTAFTCVLHRICEPRHEHTIFAAATIDASEPIPSR